MARSKKIFGSFHLSSFALLAAVGATWLVSACGSDKKGEAQRAKLTEPCTLNSDCNSPLVCAFQRCHSECNATRDCPNPERCVKSTDTVNVCQFPTDRTCHVDSECSGKEKCAEDKECRDPCQAASDCTKGQVCSTRGNCAEPSECLMTAAPADPASCMLPERTEPVTGGAGSSAGGDSGVGGGNSGGGFGGTKGGGAGTGESSGGGDLGNGGEAGATPLDIDGCPPDMKNCDRSNPDCETPVNTITGCGACTVVCESAHGTPTCENLKCVVPAGNCDTDYADCDNDGKNGCESALKTDPNNCGACGRVCEGGTPCTNGSCATVTVATVGSAIVDLPVFTPNKVFILDGTGLSIIDRAPATLPATTTFEPSSSSVSITGDADFVYWTRSTTPNTLRKFSTAGTGQVIAVNEDLGGIGNASGYSWDYLRSSTTALYLAGANEPGAASGFSLGRRVATLVKDATTKPTTIISGRATIYSFVTSARHLAWVEVGNADSLYVAPVAGGNSSAVLIATLATNQYNAQTAVDGETLYWSDGDGGTAKVRRFDMATPGSAPENVAFDLQSATSIALDKQYAYYLSGPSLYRIAKDGTLPPQVVTPNAGMSWLAYVDDKYVWGVAGPSLLRTPK